MSPIITPTDDRPEGSDSADQLGHLVLVNPDESELTKASGQGSGPAGCRP